MYLSNIYISNTLLGKLLYIDLCTYNSNIYISNTLLSKYISPVESSKVQIQGLWIELNVRSVEK